MATQRKSRFAPTTIAEQLRERIEAGQWRVGERLPREQRLAEQGGWPRIDLREALEMLVQEDVLARAEDSRYIVLDGVARSLDLGIGRVLTMPVVHERLHEPIMEGHAHILAQAARRTVEIAPDDELAELLALLREMTRSAPRHGQIEQLLNLIYRVSQAGPCREIIEQANGYLPQVARPAIVTFAVMLDDVARFLVARSTFDRLTLYVRRAAQPPPDELSLILAEMLVAAERRDGPEAERLVHQLYDAYLPRIREALRSPSKAA